MEFSKHIADSQRGCLRAQLLIILCGWLLVNGYVVVKNQYYFEKYLLVKLTIILVFTLLTFFR